MEGYNRDKFKLIGTYYRCRWFNDRKNRINSILKIKIIKIIIVYDWWGIIIIINDCIGYIVSRWIDWFKFRSIL